MKKKSSLFILRLRSVNKLIQCAFLISFISVLIIELLLKNFSAPNEVFFKAGDIYLRICYSIVASSFFFFLNQHLPKEEKKSKFYPFISNKVYSIEKEIDYLIKKLNLPNDNVTPESIKEACSKINPSTEVNSNDESSLPFKNWFEYLNYKTLKIKGTIYDLLLLNEALDVELMEHLLRIENLLIHHLYFDKREVANLDLTNLSDFIYKLELFKKDLLNIRSAKYDKFVDEFYEKKRLQLLK